MNNSIPAQVLFSDNSKKYKYTKKYNDAKEAQRESGIWSPPDFNLLSNKSVNAANAYSNFDATILYNPEYNGIYDANTKEENAMLSQAYSLQSEMTIANMIDLITFINNKYGKYTITAKSIVNNVRNGNKLSTSVFAYHLLFQINEQVVSNMMSNDKHQMSLFVLNNIIDITNTINDINVKKTLNGGKLTFAIKISRRYKIYDFTLEIELNYSLDSMVEGVVNVNYESIKVVGINSDYEFNNYKKDKLVTNRSPIIDKIKQTLDYDKEYKALGDKIIVRKNQNSNNNAYNLQYTEKELMYPYHGCFILDNDNTIQELQVQNPVRCKSYWEEYGYNGVWDKKCTSNNECPFYNSKDDSGSCDISSGICEMPKSVVRVGYKQYLK